MHEDINEWEKRWYWKISLSSTSDPFVSLLAFASVGSRQDDKSRGRIFSTKYLIFQTVSVIPNSPGRARSKNKRTNICKRKKATKFLAKDKVEGIGEIRILLMYFSAHLFFIFKSIIFQYSGLASKLIAEGGGVGKLCGDLPGDRINKQWHLNKHKRFSKKPKQLEDG